MSEGLGGTSTVNRHSWNAHGEELYLIIRTITSHIKFRTRNVNHSPTYTLAQSVLLHQGTIILCTPPTAIPVHESWPRLEGSSESELWGQSEDNVET